MEGGIRFDGMSGYDYQEPGYWARGIPSPMIDVPSQRHPYMFIEVNVNFVDDTV
jgi:hypothetical protein